MAITNGGPLRAPDPDAIYITSISVTGNFTNSQYIDSYIDCSGITLSITASQSGSTIHSSLSGESIVNGQYEGIITFYDTSSLINQLSVRIEVTPSYFTIEGQQTVTFSLAFYYSGVRYEVTTTKSVNVISSEPAEKFIINAELYEESEMKGYDVYFGGNIEIAEYSTITLIDDVSEDPQEASGEDFYNLIADGFLYEGLCQISGSGTFSQIIFEADNNFKLTYINSNIETTIVTNVFEKLMSAGTSFTITFLEDTTFTSFCAI